MPNENSRYVVKDGDRWAIRAGSAARAGSVNGTQREAEQKAKGIVRRLGGGEIRIQGRNGRWRDSDTAAPANDPNPPRDSCH